MKNLKYFITGGLFVSLAAFQGCQDCTQAVTTAQQALNSRLTAVSDSVKGAWKADLDAIRAEYDVKLATLDTLLAAKAAEAAKTPTKKPATTTTKKEEPAKTDKLKDKVGQEDQKLKDKIGQPENQPDGKKLKDKLQQN